METTRSARASPRSFLLAPRPPTGFVEKELYLWWNVIRQAAHDLRFSHKSNALDAIDFLRSTGLWLSIELFDVPEERYREEVASLLRQSRSLIKTDLTFLTLT